MHAIDANLGDGKNWQLEIWINLSRSCFVNERMQNTIMNIVMHFIYFPIQIKYGRASTTAELSKKGKFIYWSVPYLSVHVEEALLELKVWNIILPFDPFESQSREFPVEADERASELFSDCPELFECNLRLV